MGLVISLMPSFIPQTPWAFGGFTGFVGYWVFYFLSQFLSPLLFSAYHKLDDDPKKNRGYQAEWDTRVSSTAQALAALAGAYHTAMASPAHRADRVGEYDPRLYVAADGSEGPTGIGPEFFCALFVGYLVADIIPVVIYRDTMANINELYGHHILASMAWSCLIYYRVTQWWGCFWLLAELSTPFVNLRWWLYKSKSTGLPYALNGLVMTAAFGYARVSHLPWTLSYLVADFAAIQQKAGWFAYFFCICFAFNACLQCYWFFLMMKGLIKGVKKMLGGGGKKKD